MGRLPKYSEALTQKILAVADKYGDQAAVDIFDEVPTTHAVRGLRGRWNRAHTIPLTVSVATSKPPKIEPPTNGNGNHSGAEHHDPPMPPHRPKAVRRHLRAGVFDVETQSFDAIGEDGVFVCGCILPLDSDEIITSRLEVADKGDDKRALAEFIGHLWTFDILIGHNIIAFDLNWLNTRRMYHGMPNLRSWLLFDTYQASRALPLSSGGKSLGNLEDVFGLEGIKTTIRKTTWSKARSQDPEVFATSMAKTIYHCEQDVIGQRELFDVLLPDAMTLNNSQFKQSKWKLGITSWETWLHEWGEAQQRLRTERQARKAQTARAA